MNLVFTICSNNYLPQAKVLRNTLKRHHPEFKFIFVLVDKFIDNCNYSTDFEDEIVLAEDLGIKDFNKLAENYNIIELNTSVKASAFRFFIKTYPEAENIFYFDPDIAILNGLKQLEDILNQYDIVLTPHITNPLPVCLERPNENDFLNYGLYNLGFVGVRRCKEVTDNFLPWWEERLMNLCFNRPCEGIFVDQLWINLVPIYFPKVFISKYPGFNMAPWNLHERKLTYENGKYKVNGEFDLVFYHFSSYKQDNPDIYFRNYPRNDFFKLDSNIKDLYKWYHNLLVEFENAHYYNVKCFYSQPLNPDTIVLDANIKSKNIINRLINRIKKVKKLW